MKRTCRQVPPEAGGEGGEMSSDHEEEHSR